MVSQLEDILLRSRDGTRGIRHTLFFFLDDGVSLLHMRLASRVLRDLISHHSEYVFRQLYMPTTRHGLKQRRAFELIAKHCQHLTITIRAREYGRQPLLRPTPPCVEKPLKPQLRESNGSQVVKTGYERLPNQDSQPSLLSKDSSPTLYTSEASRTSSSLALAQPWCVDNLGRCGALLEWQKTFSQLSSLCFLTLRVHGDPSWPGRTEVEEELFSIRIAIERAGANRLRGLRLMPVHAMGIVHLQWSMLHAFGKSIPIGRDVWRKIKTLDLRIRNPFQLTEEQTIMFHKHLYSFLSSFAPGLHHLRLVWLDCDGPSPLALHFEHGLEKRAPIRWHELQEVWLGNIANLHRTVRLMPDVAPKVSLAMTLRADYPDSLSVNQSDATAWVQILLEEQNVDVDNPGESHDEQYLQPRSPSAGGVSETSREIPFMLDLG